MAHNFYTKIGFAAIEAVVCFSSRWRWMNQQNQGGQGNGGALIDRQKCEIWHQLLRTYLESEWRNHIRSPPNVGQLQEGLTMLEVCYTARTFPSPPNECWRMCPIALYGDYILGRPMNWTVGTVDSARFQAPCRPILHLFTLGIIVGETPLSFGVVFQGQTSSQHLMKMFHLNRRCFGYHQHEAEGWDFIILYPFNMGSYEQRWQPSFTLKIR